MSSPETPPVSTRDPGYDPEEYDFIDPHAPEPVTWRSGVDEPEGAGSGFVDLSEAPSDVRSADPPETSDAAAAAPKFIDLTKPTTAAEAPEAGNTPPTHWPRKERFFGDKVAAFAPEKDIKIFKDNAQVHKENQFNHEELTQEMQKALVEMRTDFVQFKLKTENKVSAQAIGVRAEGPGLARYSKWRYEVAMWEYQTTVASIVEAYQAEHKTDVEATEQFKNNLIAYETAQRIVLEKEKASVSLRNKLIIKYKERGRVSKMLIGAGLVVGATVGAGAVVGTGAAGLAAATRLGRNFVGNRDIHGMTATEESESFLDRLKDGTNNTWEDWSKSLRTESVERRRKNKKSLGIAAATVGVGSTVGMVLVDDNTRGAIGNTRPGEWLSERIEGVRDRYDDFRDRARGDGTFDTNTYLYERNIGSAPSTDAVNLTSFENSEGFNPGQTAPSSVQTEIGEGVQEISEPAVEEVPADTAPEPVNEVEAESVPNSEVLFYDVPAGGSITEGLAHLADSEGIEGVDVWKLYVENESLFSPEAMPGQTYVMEDGHYGIAHTGEFMIPQETRDQLIAAMQDQVADNVAVDVAAQEINPVEASTENVSQQLPPLEVELPDDVPIVESPEVATQESTDVTTTEPSAVDAPENPEVATPETTAEAVADSDVIDISQISDEPVEYGDWVERLVDNIPDNGDLDMTDNPWNNAQRLAPDTATSLYNNAVRQLSNESGVNIFVHNLGTSTVGLSIESATGPRVTMEGVLGQGDYSENLSLRRLNEIMKNMASQAIS